nr:DNA replication factor Dna2-like nuclease [uncultured Mediterranean phage uvMED]
MLSPLPVAFNEERHEYTWEPTGETMLWSVSEVVKPLTPEQREWLEKNSHYAERGTAIHKSLERFLGGDPSGWLDSDFEQYEEWTDHLIFHSWWDDIEILALEHRLADPKRSIGGSFDGLIKKDGKTCIYDLKTKEHESSRREKPLAQLGAYSQMLEQHYKLLPDEAWVVWSYPGGCDFERLDVMQCLDSWAGAWIKHEARQELF